MLTPIVECSATPNQNDRCFNAKYPNTSPVKIAPSDSLIGFPKCTIAYGMDMIGNAYSPYRPANPLTINPRQNASPDKKTSTYENS